jgi:hypothetical protein
MMSPRNFASVLASVLALAANSSSAETIVFQFSGTVVYGAPMAVLPGARIAGTYSYDTKTDAAITNKGFADYQIPAPHTMSATVDGHTISTSNLHVTVWNHMRGNVEDMVQVFAGPVVLDGTTFADGALGLALASAPRNNKALKNTKLPSTLNVADFDAGPSLTYGTFQRDGGPDGTLLQFSVDSITVLQTTP